MEKSTAVEWLSKAIEQATRSAKFCVSGCLPVVDPGIQVEGLGAITLPLKPRAAKELVRTSERVVDRRIMQPDRLTTNCPRQRCMGMAACGA